MNKYLLRKGDTVRAVQPLQYGRIKKGDIGRCISTTTYGHCPVANHYIIEFKTGLCPISIPVWWPQFVKKIGGK